MWFSKAIVFLLIIVMVFVLGEKMLRNLFNIGKRDKNRPRFINKVHMWGEIIIISLFTVSFFYIYIELFDTRWTGLIVPFLFLIIELFRTLMEWMYQREKREYIIHLFAVSTISTFVVVAAFTNWIDLLLGL